MIPDELIDEIRLIYQLIDGLKIEIVSINIDNMDGVSYCFGVCDMTSPT